MKRQKETELLNVFDLLQGSGRGEDDLDLWVEEQVFLESLSEEDEDWD